MIYEIILKSIGDITLLPDSQKLFGFLMSKLSENFRQDEVSSYIDDIYENKIKCMVSNLLPKGYIPFPKAYILDIIPDNSKDIYKLIKKFEYISENSLKSIISYFKTHSIGKISDIKRLEKEWDTEIEFVSTKQRYLQKFKLESQEKSIPGLLNRSYSLPILEYYYNDREICCDFSFHVEVDDNNILSSYLKQLCKNIRIEKKKIYGLGAKVSHGYNTYCIEDIIRLENKENYKKYIYLNMGMLIPEIENINIESSFVDIYSSNRKSYEISDNIEKVISFISPGSVIDIKNKCNNLGRCITNKYNIMYKNAIIFGNSFVKKIEVN